MHIQEDKMISTKHALKQGSLIQGKDLNLQLLSVEACSEQYVDWLNDPEVNRFLETRWQTQDLQSVQSFVRQMWDNDDTLLFAIILNDGKKHIGNIKLGPVNVHHRCADISFFLGCKQEWGKGYATQAIRLVRDYAFDVGLHRLQAGLYQSNTASFKALTKAGFQLEGCLRAKLFLEGVWEDHLLLGLLANDYIKDADSSRL